MSSSHSRKQYPELSLLIDGQWRRGEGRTVIPVIDPADESTLGDLPLASPRDIDEAIDAARRGFELWRNVSPLERATMLRRAADSIRADGQSIAALVTMELGKPYAEAQLEVQTAAEMFDWAAEETRRLYGRVIPSRKSGTRQLVVMEPVGPVAGFSGWNAPAITPSRKISAALAAGCSIVLKAAEETPATAIAIARSVHGAGLPAGVLNVVFGDPAAVSSQLLMAAAVKAVTFTGSTSIGRSIGEQAARTLKRAILELGGHAPVLVFGDVDPLAVATAAAAAKYRNAGQVCTSPTRFYVHESIVARFAARFCEVAGSIKVGNGFEDGVRMGPLANGRRREAMERFADDARARGIRIALGGSPIAGRGYFWRPTVFTDFHDDCLAAQIEPFGPLALIKPFASLDEAIAQANRLPFGLAAYAFTDRASVAQAVSEAVDSGVVCINEWSASLPETPFGGAKDSGLGSEGGAEGINAFLKVKCIRQS